MSYKFNRCLLDTNIIMDKILNRKRATIFDTEFVFKYSEFFISAKTFSTCFYLLRKQGMSKTEIYNDLTPVSNPRHYRADLS